MGPYESNKITSNWFVLLLRTTIILRSRTHNIRVGENDLGFELDIDHWKNLESILSKVDVRFRVWSALSRIIFVSLSYSKSACIVQCLKTTHLSKESTLNC